MIAVLILSHLTNQHFKHYIVRNITQNPTNSYCQNIIHEFTTLSISLLFVVVVRDVIRDVFIRKSRDRYTCHPYGCQPVIRVTRIHYKPYTSVKCTTYWSGVVMTCVLLNGIQWDYVTASHIYCCDIMLRNVIVIWYWGKCEMITNGWTARFKYTVDMAWLLMNQLIEYRLRGWGSLTVTYNWNNCHPAITAFHFNISTIYKQRLAFLTVLKQEQLFDFH